jgi:hypothetical protein
MQLNFKTTFRSGFFILLCFFLFKSGYYRNIFINIIIIMHFIDFICYLNDKSSIIVQQKQTIRSFNIN